MTPGKCSTCLNKQEGLQNNPRGILNSPGASGKGGTASHCQTAGSGGILGHKKWIYSDLLSFECTKHPQTLCHLPVLQLGEEKQGKGEGRRLCPHLYPLNGGFYPELLHGPAGLGDVVGGGGCFARHFQGSREFLLGKTRGCYCRRQQSTLKCF